ncbi:MAG TPA: hypothetical protein VF692_08440, partial [Pyrinomonadaceae bacterium]
MTIGALLMFFFALTVAAITVDMPSSHSARIIGLVVAWLILSVLINITPIIRYFAGSVSPTEEKDSARMLSGLTSKIKSKAQTSALPPAHTPPAADFVTERVNTAEMA